MRCHFLLEDKADQPFEAERLRCRAAVAQAGLLCGFVSKGGLPDPGRAAPPFVIGVSCLHGTALQSPVKRPSLLRL